MVVQSRKVFFFCPTVRRRRHRTCDFHKSSLNIQGWEMLPLNLTLYFYNIKSFQMKNL